MSKVIKKIFQKFGVKLSKKYEKLPPKYSLIQG